MKLSWFCHDVYQIGLAFSKCNGFLFLLWNIAIWAYFIGHVLDYQGLFMLI